MVRGVKDQLNLGCLSPESERTTMCCDVVRARGISEHLAALSERIPIWLRRSLTSPGVHDQSAGEEVEDRGEVARWPTLSPRSRPTPTSIQACTIGCAVRKWLSVIASSVLSSEPSTPTCGPALRRMLAGARLRTTVTSHPSVSLVPA